MGRCASCVTSHKDSEHLQVLVPNKAPGTITHPWTLKANYITSDTITALVASCLSLGKFSIWASHVSFMIEDIIAIILEIY